MLRAKAPANADHAIIQGKLAFLNESQLRKAGGKCRVGTEAPVVPPLRKRGMPVRQTLR